MSINNTPKPTGSVNNSLRVSDIETWNSNTTTWDTETRTWDEMGTVLSNTARPMGTVNNTSKPA